MSGYSFSYKIYKKYIVDILEHYEETDYTRVFIYRKNVIGRDLIEIMDFPTHTEKSVILDAASKFINELEKLISPARFSQKFSKKRRGTSSKTPEKTSEKSIEDL